MAPIVISDETKIGKCNVLFETKLSSYIHEEFNISVGFQGGNIEVSAKYLPELDIWFSINEYTGDNRFWNAFGIGKPKQGRSHSIIAEINFPFEGIDRRVAGVFAEESDGNILVLHRGKIDGGKRGIGKEYFTNHFRGDFVTAIDGDKETEFCLIGELNSKHFPKQVANFVKEVYRVKKQPENEENINIIESSLNNFNFTSEHFGHSTSKSQGDRKINRTHGIVVNALAKELEKRKYKIGNDVNRDLYIYKGNEITMLFEIKINSSTHDICTAVGQLIVYSIPIKNRLKLIIVFPECLNSVVTDRLLQLGIVPLYYSWINEMPKFIELENILQE